MFCSHGATAHSRKQSILLTADEKRKMSMGYEKYLGGFTGEDQPQFDANELGLGFRAGATSTRPATAIGGDKHFVFRNEFHMIMHNLVESRIYSGFILFIILLNTAVLIAQTWLEVSLNAGKVLNIYFDIYSSPDV